MRFFQFRLPSVLALLLLSCPLVSRADQTQLDSPVPVQTASPEDVTVIQPTQQIELTDADILVTAQPVEQQQNTDLTPIDIDPTPINIDPTPIDGPTPINIGTGDPSPTAVTPEPSSMVLLATGLLLGGLMWTYERS